MVKGKEFHGIIYNIFNCDVDGYLETPQLKVNCPRCQKRDGLSSPDGKYNLEINTEKKVFRCWKCDQPKFSGYLGRLIQMYGSNSDFELFKSYAGSNIDRFSTKEATEDDDLDITIELPKEFISFRDMDVSNQTHLDAYMYLVNERKISKEKIHELNIGLCTEGKYFNRIIIPSYDSNGIVNYFISRAFYKGMKPTYMNPKVDKDKIIFNEGLINWDSTIYIIEGFFDSISICNGAPQLGKTLSNKMFQRIKEKKPYIVIVLDPDAYTNAVSIFQTLSAIYGIESEKVRIVKLKGKMDLDEIRRNLGENEVVKLLRTATQLTLDDYFTMRRYNNKYDWQPKKHYQFT